MSRSRSFKRQNVLVLDWRSSNSHGLPCESRLKPELDHLPAPSTSTPSKPRDPSTTNIYDNYWDDGRSTIRPPQT